MFVQEDYFKNIFNTVREAIIVLDENMRVLSANRSFFAIFNVDSAHTINSLLYDLGNGQWNIPHLRVLLEDVLPNNDTIDDYEIEHSFESIGRKTMLLNACKIKEKIDGQPIILLAIEDITERKRLEELLSESEMRYRRIFETASDGILLLEKSKGNIAHANQAAEKMTGYSAEKCIGKTLQEIGVSIDVSDFPEIMATLGRNGIINYEDVPVKTRSGQDIVTDIYLVDRAVLAQCNIRDVTERKQAEKELKTSEERFRSAAESLTDVIYDWDTNEKIEWYGNIDGIMGYQPGGGPRSFEGWQTTIHPDDKDRVLMALQDGISGVAPYVVEYRVKRRDGEWRWWSARGTMLRDERGEAYKMIGSVTDITEQKEAEVALLKSETEFRSLAESMPQIVWITRPDGWNTYFNQQWVDYTGLTLEESYGHGWNTPFHPDDKQSAWDAWQRATQNGDIYSLECRLRRADGVYRWWLIRGVQQFNGNGEIDKWFGTCTDIEEIKRAEQELKESKELFEAVVENVPLMIFLKEATDLRFLLLNRAGEELLGYDRTEFLGKSDLDLFPPEQAANFMAKDREVLESESCVVDIPEEPVLTAKKGERHLHTRKVCIRGADGAMKYLLGISEDITERKRAEEEKSRLEAQLRQSQKMEAVGTLAGGVAHDFNNILNVIMGYGSMIIDTLAAGSTAKEQMREVLIAADRAAELTKRLLVFSRKQVVDVKSVNINELILGLQKMLVRIIRESIDFNLELAEYPLIVLADAGQIEQVMINLASNAKDAMQEGGRLTISTELASMDDEYVAFYGYGKPGRYALISVSDTGQGMDAETQIKIFEPFFTTKGIGEGTGLGLAISYGIIKQHGGFIKVYSEPGKGTAFKIHLLLSEEAASPDNNTDAANPVIGGSETVLVAEDDASLRKLAQIMLESFGYTVITAVDGEDALAKFMENRERISLALLDMIMPKKMAKRSETHS